MEKIGQLKIKKIFKKICKKYSNTKKCINWPLICKKNIRGRVSQDKGLSNYSGWYGTKYSQMWIIFN